MTKPFLIVGLPRSRTAWMSVAATNDRSICFHEPLSRMNEWQDVAAIWRSGDYEFTGISDSSLGFHLPHILETSAPRTLIVGRPLDDVVKSLAGIGVDGAGYCSLLSRYLDAVGEHPLVRFVSFSHLSDIAVVAESLRWLMPGLGVDMNKLGELMKLNVQADMGLVWRDVESRKADMPALIGSEIIEQLAASTAG